MATMFVLVTSYWLKVDPNMLVPHRSTLVLNTALWPRIPHYTQTQMQSLCIENDIAACNEGPTEPS
jgi:hypothetical protein